MPFSASSFLASSTFPFSFLFGRNPVLSFWKSFVIILLPCPSSLRPFLSVPWEVARALFVFCFLFSSSVFFYRAVPVFLFFSLCLKGSAPIDGSWGSLLLILCRGPLFLLDASFSGLQDPLGLSFIPSWVSCIYYFGLSLNFPFGLISLWPFFRPQQCLNNSFCYLNTVTKRGLNTFLMKWLNCHFSLSNYFTNYIFDR